MWEQDANGATADSRMTGIEGICLLKNIPAHTCKSNAQGAEGVSVQTRGQPGYRASLVSEDKQTNRNQPSLLKVESVTM